MDTTSFPTETILIPGPSFHVDLAPIDALHPIHYTTRLHIFRCASSAQFNVQLTALAAGLKALLSRCPILGGITSSPPRSIMPAQEDWRTIIPAAGLELTVRDLRHVMPSFSELEAENFPPLQLPHELLSPVPRSLGKDSSYAACKVQFSAIHGGSVFAFANSHSVGDGGALTELMRVLSEEVRLAQGRDDVSVESSLSTGAVTTKTPTMGLDRSMLRNITSDMPFDIKNHPAYRLSPTPTTTTPAPLEPPSPHPFAATTPEIPILLHIPATALARLKADATPSSSPSSSNHKETFISTHDALCALVWRTTLLIRSRRSSTHHPSSASTPANFYMPSDARKHLGLPTSYVGNAVYQLTASLPLGILLDRDAKVGLREAAAAIRRCIVSTTPKLVGSYYAKLRETWIGWAFLEDYNTTGVGMGSGWTSGEVVYESSDWGSAFGGGKVVRYRYPGGVGVGGITVLPKLGGGGGAEVVLCVQEGEVGTLMGMEGFGPYLEG